MNRINEKTGFSAFAILWIVCIILGIIVVITVDKDVRDEYGWIIFASTISMPTVICLIGTIREFIRIRQPEKKEQANILEKGHLPGAGRHNNHVPYVTFEFADGTRHKMDVSNPIYDMLRKNSKILLYYKEMNGKKWFIGFEYAPTQPFPQESVEWESFTVEQPNNLWPARIALFFLAFVLFVFFATLKTWWSGNIAFFVILPLTFLCFWSIGKREKRIILLNQSVAATIFKKKLYSNYDRRITFLLENGTTIEVSVLPNNYAVLMKGDTGMFTYMEKNHHFRFIAFEVTG